MQLLKRLVILSGYHVKGKGIIKIESFNNKSKVEVKIFEPLKSSYRLGIRIDLGRLYEYDLDSSSSIVELIYTNLDNRIDCVIVDDVTLKPLLYGSTQGSDIDISRTIEMFTHTANEIDEISIDKKATQDNQLDKVSDYTAYDSSDQEVILDKIIEEQAETPKADKIEAIESSDKEKVQEYKDKLEQDFFIEIKPQLDELFKCYPADKELMLSVPDSKWVRVNYEKDEYYVVGVLYNGKRATHICYGVPGNYSVRPKQKSEWLPLDYLDPEGKGYWVIFQDALTGKTLE